MAAKKGLPSDHPHLFGSRLLCQHTQVGPWAWVPTAELGRLGREEGVGNRGWGVTDSLWEQCCWGSSCAAALLCAEMPGSAQTR